MAQALSLELMLFLAVTILCGLIYLLFLSSKDSHPEDDSKTLDDSKSSPEESEEDRQWRAKRFWWFGR